MLCHTQNEEVWSSESGEPNQHSTYLNPYSNSFYLPSSFNLLTTSNAAINSATFVKFFVRAIGIAFHCEGIVNAAESMPVGITTVHKLLGASCSDLKLFACPKCHSVYRYEDP